MFSLPGTVSEFIVCPMLKWTPAPSVIAPLEFRSQVPHVVSAMTYAGMPNSAVMRSAASCTCGSIPSGPFSETDAGRLSRITRKILSRSTDIMRYAPPVLI